MTFFDGEAQAVAEELNSVVTTTVQGGVAVLLCNNPPVNAFGQAVVHGLHAHIQRALGAQDVRAIVILCEGKSFFTGADISEFGSTETPPTADDLLEFMETSSKPIIAAMHGRAWGGGLELALACHYRVAMAGTQFGFPEVTLGLIPGLGGTQRFPRLVGFGAALSLIPTGKSIGTDQASAIGLIDDVVAEGTLLDGALAFARTCEPATAAELHDRLARNRNDHLEEASNDRAQFDSARALLKRRYKMLQAPQLCVDAIELALDQSFEEALANERAIFDRCVASDEAEAQTYLFFAERQARKVALPFVEAQSLRKVGIVGGGTMGRGILIAVLEAGFQAVLVERDAEAAERCGDTVCGHFRKRVKAGVLSNAQLAETASRMRFTADWADLADCDLVIEAVFEDLELKREIFRRLSSLVRPDTILATNTSGLCVERIAEVAASPENVIGLHFFSPANVMRLLEIVQAPATSAKALYTALAFARSLNKVAVVSQDAEGFIGNRMFDEYWREAEFLVEEGASPYDVDRAMEEFGMAMGSFAVADLAGLDLGHAIRVRYESQAKPDMRLPQAEEQLFQAGRHGQKNGVGWYEYSSGRAAADPVVLKLLDEHRANLGHQPAQFGPEEINMRCIAALVGEGRQLLKEGVATRASDIDLVAVYGYGFPRHLGGPMRWAERSGQVLEPWLEKSSPLRSKAFVAATEKSTSAASSEGKKA